MTANNPLAAITELANKLKARNPGLEAHITSFSSGSAMLDVKRNGRSWVFAYSPKRGFGVDQLHQGEGLMTGFRFVSDDFESAAQRFAELTNEEEAPTISLLVLQAQDIEKSKEFYGLLGLDFAEEKHGKGPRHYAAIVDGVVFEIYPCQKGESTALRVGFHVPALDAVVDRLRANGVPVLSEPADSPWGRRAVVEDPDGNRVELSGQQS